MAIIKENQIIFSKNGEVYQITNCDACSGCCFFEFLDCDLALRELFGYKYKFHECKQLIGSNSFTRLGFKKIGFGGI